MELIGSLTRDIRSLCVVIQNIGKELVNLRDL